MGTTIGFVATHYHHPPSATMKSVETLSEFDEMLKDAADKLVVVDFTATWCGPCKAISPKFEELAKNNPNIICFKVDVDEGEEIAQHYKVNCMPTFLFFKGGKQVANFSGANYEEIKKLVDQHK